VNAVAMFEETRGRIQHVPANVPPVTAGTPDAASGSGTNTGQEPLARRCHRSVAGRKVLSLEDDTAPTPN
jgi:hypothetical protein